MLRSFGIECMVIDFHKPTGPENRHPEMLKWVWAYFDGYYQQSHRDVKKRKLQNFFAAPPSNQSKTATAKASDAFASLENTPPLYLQHEGHSRTIIGVEKKKNGSVGLLILGIILSLSLFVSLSHIHPPQQTHQTQALESQVRWRSETSRCSGFPSTRYDTRNIRL